jgi:hypothetical protein
MQHVHTHVQSSWEPGKICGWEQGKDFYITAPEDSMRRLIRQNSRISIKPDGGRASVSLLHQ